MIKVLLLIISVAIIFNQNQLDKEFYVESWKKGNKKIEEQNVILEMKRYNSSVEEKIKDEKGKDKYVLEGIQLIDIKRVEGVCEAQD